MGLGRAPSTRARAESGRAAPRTRPAAPSRRWAGPLGPGRMPVGAGEREVTESDPGSAQRPLDPAEGPPRCCVSVSAGRRRRWPDTQTRARRRRRLFGAAAGSDPGSARPAGGDQQSLHLTPLPGSGRATFRVQVRAGLRPAWGRNRSAVRAERPQSLEEGAVLPWGARGWRAPVHPEAGHGRGLSSPSHIIRSNGGWMSGSLAFGFRKG